jgi:ATP-binding cassette subfamily B protein
MGTQLNGPCACRRRTGHLRNRPPQPPLVVPLVLKWVVDGPVSDGHAAGVWLGGGVLLLLGVFEAGIFGVRRWLMARPLAAVEASMRGWLHDHLQRLPVSFHDRWSSGQLVSRGTADLGALQGFLALALPFLVVNGATLLVGCVLLLAQQWVLGLVLLAPVVPLLALCSFLEARYGLAARQAREQAGDLTTMAEESVLGFRVVKSFGHHHRLTRAFRQRALQIRGTELAKARLLAALSALLAVLPDASLGAVLVLGAVEVADGELSAGTLLAFLAIAMELRPVVTSTGSLLAMSSDAAAAADRYFEVMDEPAPADHSRAPLTHRAGPGAGDGSEAAAAEVVFEGVEFRYPDASPGEPAVLRSVSLRIAPGETVALVGATGSGKSTLVTLVPRLLEPTGGRILLDGADVTALTRAELRRQVSVAFEEPPLFSTTVAENVLLGAEHADEADLTRALGIAQADGFVQILPDGALTHVGEQGMSLSVASVSGWRWLVPSSVGPDCSSSTIRSPRWTSARNRSSRQRCDGFWPPRRPWSSHTGRPPCCSPTGSRCCPAAGSPPSALTTTSCAPASSTPP